MLNFIIRRVIHSIYVVLAISLIVFFAVRLTGDPVALMFGAGEPTKEAIEEIQRSLGLDQPIHIQYVSFLRDLVTLDLGISYRSGESVTNLVLERMPATLALTFSGIFVALLIAFPVGIFSAIKRGTMVDFGGRAFSLFGISFPNFWLGIMFILVFSVHLQWLPASGFNGIEYLVLPALTLGLILSGILARLVRSSMLEVLNKQYINTARSKGISEYNVIIKHGFRTALIPTITYIGIQFGSLLGGTVIIEQVFSWPGVGRMIVDAISQRDFPVVQGGVIMLAFLMVAVNLIIDLSYAIIDPRIKVGGGN
ncbi:ABC transporter permease [Alkalihalophilus marmarensis]|uniref:nickel ABC transporter permease n=1 Tax=Alkalihalophilus marmarensis TaxID=521377 RepID=UPI00203F74D1|nr:nickel ABC transporter permease [Alkalihalophilus marmarensis]MCM3489824.1 ABC transporter permease [Alkalihalophilus marmarensis]